ncbi:MAG: hypothetical protein ACTSYZ_13070 [Candidatus Helarchaeota archaeon]
MKNIISFNLNNVFWGTHLPKIGKQILVYLAKNEPEKLEEFLASWTGTLIGMLEIYESSGHKEVVEKCIQELKKLI